MREQRSPVPSPLSRPTWRGWTIFAAIILAWIAWAAYWTGHRCYPW
jgi:hypothetical protein